jgi:hypothetical protein
MAVVLEKGRREGGRRAGGLPQVTARERLGVLTQSEERERDEPSSQMVERAKEKRGSERDDGGACRCRWERGVEGEENAREYT